MYIEILLIVTVALVERWHSILHRNPLKTTEKALIFHLLSESSPLIFEIYFSDQTSYVLKKSLNSDLTP